MAILFFVAYRSITPDPDSSTHDETKKDSPSVAHALGAQNPSRHQRDMPVQRAILLIVVAAVLVSGSMVGREVYIKYSCEEWLLKDKRAQEVLSYSSTTPTQSRRETVLEVCQETGSGIVALMIVEAAFAARDAAESSRYR